MKMIMRIRMGKRKNERKRNLDRDGVLSRLGRVESAGLLELGLEKECFGASETDGSLYDEDEGEIGEGRSDRREIENVGRRT